MKNPITVASGTFGYGREFAEYIDLNNFKKDIAIYAYAIYELVK